MTDLEKHALYPCGLLLLRGLWRHAAGRYRCRRRVPIFTLERKVAPFGSGTNSRVLGRYVSEKGSLSLQDAIAKMTYLPAKMLQDFSPSMAKKGRMKPGADADITVFDPATIIDNATYADPYRASSGIVHALVGGQFALRDGELQQVIFASRRVLH